MVVAVGVVCSVVTVEKRGNSISFSTHRPRQRSCECPGRAWWHRGAAGAQVGPHGCAFQLSSWYMRERERERERERKLPGLCTGVVVLMLRKYMHTWNSNAPPESQRLLHVVRLRLLDILELRPTYCAEAVVMCHPLNLPDGSLDGPGVWCIHRVAAHLHHVISIDTSCATTHVECVIKRTKEITHGKHKRPRTAHACSSLIRGK